MYLIIYIFSRHCCIGVKKTISMWSDLSYYRPWGGCVLKRKYVLNVHFGVKQRRCTVETDQVAQSIYETQGQAEQTSQPACTEPDRLIQVALHLARWACSFRPPRQAVVMVTTFRIWQQQQQQQQRSTDENDALRLLVYVTKEHERSSVPFQVPLYNTDPSLSFLGDLWPSKAVTP